jgi:hypothetical protein
MLAVLWLTASIAGFRCYHAPKTLPAVQPRNPVQAIEAANPVMIKSRDQIGFDTTATEASIGPSMIFDRTVASASGNLVLTMIRLCIVCSGAFLTPARPCAQQGSYRARVIPKLWQKSCLEKVPSMPWLEYDSEPVNALGANRLSAFKRLVRFAKLTTLLSGVSTILCATAVFGVQVSSWLRTDVWETYQLSSALSKSDESAVYVTASTDKFQIESTNTQTMVEWFFGLPIVLLLLIAAGLHVVFYLYLVALEKQQDVGGRGWQSERRTTWAVAGSRFRTRSASWAEAAKAATIPRNIPAAAQG